MTTVQRVTDALPLRIFLASPGDLDDERAAVRASVAEHRARRAGMSNVVYEVVEWDRVRGTARRAREAINELIAESHFMVVLFKAAWGSEPGSPWGYTSGTEEELFTGLLELGQVEQPMRDVWVGFMEHPSPVQRIDELRQHIIEQHSVIFESIADLPDLKSKLADRLESWEALAGSKNPRHIELLPSSGKDVLRAANRRIRGEKFVELGQPELGRVELEEAAALGGPVEHLAYAKWLRRSGDLGGAYASTQKAIAFFAGGEPLYSTLAADAFSAQARVLSAQGRFHDAIGRMEQALTLIPTGGGDAQGVRCRILDDFGLAYSKINDLLAARCCFESALGLRRKAERNIDVCQSLINLARLEVAEDDLEKAAEYAGEVISTLRGTPPSALHANAAVLGAQIRLRQSRPEEGITYAEQAFSLNRQIANRRGEAISLLVSAQCCREASQRKAAEQHARACLAVNEDMGDRVGAEKAQWLLDHLPD